MSHQRRKQGSADAHFFVYTPGIVVPRDVTHVLVHHSVEVLPAWVFQRCRHLKEVKLPEGLREIGLQAFCGCRSLEHVTLPSTLTKICGLAFAYCTSLTELVFPEGLTKIGEEACWGCSSLERISLPSTVTTIDNNAFYDCSLLRVVRLLDGIRTIGKCAFWNCALEDLILPATLTSIGENAFVDCRFLKVVKICGGIQTIGATMFSGSMAVEYITISSKAFVIAESGGDYHSQFVTEESIPKTDSAQVVIASEGFNSLRTCEIPEVERAITGILLLSLGWDAQCERLREILAPYELRHKKEVTTLLELGLWKTKMDANPGIKEECRVNCGAAIIIPQVLPFL